MTDFHNWMKKRYKKYIESGKMKILKISILDPFSELEKLGIEFSDECKKEHNKFLEDLKNDKFI